MRFTAVSWVLVCYGFLDKILAVIFCSGALELLVFRFIHALILLCPIFLSALSYELSQEYNSRGLTPVF